MGPGTHVVNTPRFSVSSELSGDHIDSPLTPAQFLSYSRTPLLLVPFASLRLPAGQAGAPKRSIRRILLLDHELRETLRALGVKIWESQG